MGFSSISCFFDIIDVFLVIMLLHYPMIILMGSVDVIADDVSLLSVGSLDNVTFLFRVISS